MSMVASYVSAACHNGYDPAAYRSDLMEAENGAKGHIVPTMSDKESEIRQ